MVSALGDAYVALLSSHGDSLWVACKSHGSLVNFHCSFSHLHADSAMKCVIFAFFYTSNYPIDSACTLQITRTNNNKLHDLTTLFIPIFFPFAERSHVRETMYSAQRRCRQTNSMNFFSLFEAFIHFSLALSVSRPDAMVEIIYGMD